MINQTLDLGIPEPEETYSSSDHFYEQLDIPRTAPRAACRKAAQTLAGLDAEVLEDLGETGKSGGRRPQGAGRGGRAVATSARWRRPAVATSRGGESPR